MRNYRTGLLKVTRFALKTSSVCVACSEAVADVGCLEIEDFDQFGESFPVVAAPLTTAVQYFEKYPLELMKVVLQTVI